MQKQKLVLSFLFVFLLFGMMLHSPIVLADEGDNSGTSDSADDDSASESDDEDDDRKDRLKDEIKERIREKSGKIVREVEGRFIDAEGNEVKFKRKITIKNGKVEIETKLKIDGEGSNLSVEDSEGRKHRIKVTPEKLRALMERFNANNITNFSLEEVKHKNIPRVVYKINSEHPGRFLGIFKIALRAETQVDPETGEILAINGPWWAFLVADQIPDEEEIVGNETVAEEVVANKTELEDEFEDAEVDVEIEDESEDEAENEIENENEVEDEEENETPITGEIIDETEVEEETTTQEVEPIVLN